MKKKKLPYWYRYMRYMLNSLWYYVLFPIGTEQEALIVKTAIKVFQSWNMIEIQ
ncbi:hypothetical protein [Olleya sp.]|jgi:hypothetical protein|uniref:hypothetical protein n=1 Tax=Olleya sp. TaxID=1906788 RepID=UPI0032D8FBC8